MGNFIFGYNFVDYTPIASSEDSTNYAATNLKIYTNLGRCWRSSNTSQTTISCNFGSSKNIIGIVLDDVNFINVSINSNNYTIPLDKRVQRYKRYFPVSISASSITITIPNQTTTDNLSKFRMGRLVFLDTILELNMNISYPYDYSATKPYKTNIFDSLGIEKIKLGNRKAFKCGFRFNPIDYKYEDDLWELDNIDEDSPFVMFENDNDYSKVYVCTRDGSVEVTEPAFGIRETGGIIIKELI